MTILLWSAWARPVEALVRLTGGSRGADGALLWDAFLRDLGDASSATSPLVVLLYAWGGYERHRARRVLPRARD